MVRVSESDGRPLKPGEIDGMEDLLGDDILPTDWDLAVENPPHAGWMARCRIQIYRALQSIEASINRNEGRQ